jgi:hypothetical protein
MNFSSRTMPHNGYEFHTSQLRCTCQQMLLSLVLLSCPNDLACAAGSHQQLS